MPALARRDTPSSTPDDYIARQCFRHAPYASVLSACALVALHYTVTDNYAWRYSSPSIGGRWYTPLSASLAHISDEHLYTNVVTLVLVGGLFETTEGPLRFAAVWWASATTGFGFHGWMRPDKRALGASGVVYGLMSAQASILALNWAEMPLRWLRAVLLAAMFALETALYFASYSATIAYGAHWGGAAAGALGSLVLSVNLTLHPAEVALNWLGVLVYAAAAAMLAAAGEYHAGALGAALLPALGGAGVAQTRRCLRDRAVRRARGAA